MIIQFGNNDKARKPFMQGKPKSYVPESRIKKFRERIRKALNIGGLGVLKYRPHGHRYWGENIQEKHCCKISFMVYVLNRQTQLPLTDPGGHFKQNRPSWKIPPCAIHSHSSAHLSDFKVTGIIFSLISTPFYIYIYTMVLYHFSSWF